MRTRLVTAAVLAALLVVATAGSALAAKGGGKGGGGGGGAPAAVVSLGDSYISGEGGRWLGNSNTQTGNRNGTDRAARSEWWGWSYDAHRVYGSSYDNGCNRSDVAEVRSATVPGAVAVNLACSGAETANVLRSRDGGVSFKGEAPQADQLADVAREYDVQVIVLSIGGNDLGFSDIIADCAARWSSSSSSNPDHCHDDQQPLVDARMPAAMQGVADAIASVREAMRRARDTDYRLVLQGYPSPIPRAAENRYPESGWDRLDTGGCPFWDADSDWARDTLVDQINDALAGVAASAGVDFLDLRDLLQGREVCSTATSLVGSGGPSATGSEWVRFLVSGWFQGDLQESFHPNAYGQQALGACLTAMVAASGDHACTNVSGQGTGSVVLTPT